jgi:nitrite reductase/ring-hydroxylating ferredoxin subunit
VIATLLPFLDRSLLFARAHPRRSYVVTARIEGALPGAGFISAGSPGRSVRSIPFRGEELLMIGGESHHVGSPQATPERYHQLADFAREHWDVRSFEHRWSSQDFMPVDDVPYVGLAHPLTQRTYVATGFRKWGMTGGTAAAGMISDAILGTPNPWAGFFAANRFRPVASARSFLTENGRVGFRMVGDRVLHRGGRALDDLSPGEGDIVHHEGTKVAGHCDDDGTLHAVSARCTHLGCQVAWNSAERSWDCPCHGSRFAPDGSVLCGPATRPLRRHV